MITTLIGAIALAAAHPAADHQVGGSDAAHGSHSAHQGMDHSKNAMGSHDCMKCCEEMAKRHGETMPCLEEKGPPSTSGESGQRSN